MEKELNPKKTCIKIICFLTSNFRKYFSARRLEGTFFTIIQYIGHGTSVVGSIKQIEKNVSFSKASFGIEVICKNEVIARSKKSIVLREPGYPLIYYVPPEDIRLDLLKKISRTTYCPWKGTASYWVLKIDLPIESEVAWSYENPYQEAKIVEGYLSFYTDDRIKRRYF